MVQPGTRRTRRTADAGSDLDVYYDVCGLEKWSARTAMLVLAKGESGLRRLGRSVEPINITYDEAAKRRAGPRHDATARSTLAACRPAPTG